MLLAMLHLFCGQQDVNLGVEECQSQNDFSC